MKPQEGDNYNGNKDCYNDDNGGDNAEPFYGNTKTPSIHGRLGSSATLSQLAFPWESNLISTWEKSKWDNTIVKEEEGEVTTPPTTN